MLKISQTFIRRYGPRPSPLAEAVVTIARKLDMEVVAEGVETPLQYQWLCGLGVDYGQGYYFNPPLSASDAEALLRAQAAARPR